MAFISKGLKRVIFLLASIVVIASVAACGGGGGGGGAPPPAASSPLAVLQGTWLAALGACQIEISSAGTAVGSSRETLVFNPPAANGSVAAAGSDLFYSSNNCAGTPVATVIAPTDSFVANGTKLVGTISVIKVDISFGGGLPSFSGTNARLVAAGSTTCNGQAAVVVTLGSGTNTTTTCYASGPASTIKNILAVNAAATTFDAGDTRGGLDAQGYPNSLNAIANRYVKQ